MLNSFSLLSIGFAGFFWLFPLTNTHTFSTAIAQARFFQQAVKISFGDDSPERGEDGRRDAGQTSKVVAMERAIGA